MNTSISLGWNCLPASYAIDRCWRVRKDQGYLTCPFDWAITNYENVLRCIENDFKHLTDSLQIIESPWSVGGIIKGERLIYNNEYGFIFNHESPGHANLFKTENWSGGINHFINNNFELFKERYNKRIKNFYEYVKNENNIKFVICKQYSDVSLLDKILKKKYPLLNFEIIYLPINVTNECFFGHLQLMDYKHKKEI